MHWSQRRQRRQAINEPGHAHELTFSCYRGFPFFRSETICNALAEEIESARKELDFALWAYVFMPEHIHLIVYPRQPVHDMSVILKRIKEPVGRRAVGHFRQHSPYWLQRMTVRVGNDLVRRFWQVGGGYDRNITEARTLFAMIEYIHLNPVRRGLVLNAIDWKWSSAGWFAGREPNSLRPDCIDPNLLPAG